MMVTFCTRATCRNKRCDKNQMYMEKYISDKKNHGTMVSLVNYPKDDKRQCKGYK